MTDLKVYRMLGGTLRSKRRETRGEVRDPIALGEIEDGQNLQFWGKNSQSTSIPVILLNINVNLKGSP